MVNEHFDFHSVSAAYVRYFEDIVVELSEMIGFPTYRGNWNSADISEWTAILPEYTDAEKLVVWRHESRTIYLRLSKEDKETPILISLGIEGSEATNLSYPGQFE